LVALLPKKAAFGTTYNQTKTSTFLNSATATRTLGCDRDGDHKIAGFDDHTVIPALL
jgi:hypothetical protein